MLCRPRRSPGSCSGRIAPRPWFSLEHNAILGRLNTDREIDGGTNPHHEGRELMAIRRILAAAATGVLLSAAGAMGERVSADDSFEKLTQGQEISAFRVECLYDNEAGHAMGARLRHAPSGFVLDVLRI